MRNWPKLRKFDQKQVERLKEQKDCEYGKWKRLMQKIMQQHRKKQKDCENVDEEMVEAKERLIKYVFW